MEAASGAGNGSGFSKPQFVLEACREALNKSCNRAQCRFAHPPPNVEVFGGRVQCCADFLKGKCFRVNPPCRYFHPPQHLAATMLSSAGGLPPNQDNKVSTLTNAIASCNAVLQAALVATGGAKSDKMEVCRDFIRGRCQRDDCKFAHPPEHVSVDGNYRVMACIDFLNGKCSRDKCRYFHPPPFLMKERCPSSICKDFLRGRCNRNPCRFLHSVDMSGVDDRTRELMTCRDYLNGKCSRAVCCYYHPPKSSSAEPAAEGDAAAAQPYEAMPAAANAAAADRASGASYTGSVEICRDFLLDRCNRAVCCYAHPTDVNVIRDKRAELTCKDFMRGVCHRADCRYYHPPLANTRPPIPVDSGITDYGYAAGRKRGHPDDPYSSGYVSYPQMYSADYSNAAQAEWESYYTPAKKPMTNYY